MMALMRSRTVVVVSHVCPFPTTQGNRRRIRGLLEWLKGQGFKVVYVLQPLDVDGPEGIERLRRAVDRVVVVSSTSLLERSRSLAAKLRRLLRGQWRERGLPAGDIDAWCWPATSRAVERTSARYEPAAVIAIYVLFSRCFERLPPPTLRMIDTNEVFFRNQERAPIEGLRVPLVCTETSEKKGLARADVLIAIQGHDADALRATCPGKRVITVGHACRPAPPRSPQPERGVVLYVGSGNPFNVHGLGEFLAHAWREILTSFPEATLHVVGSCAPPEGHPRVTFRGRVSDAELAAVYQRAHVVINPQVAGTGLKIKSVEAINAGCPAVMNPAGAEGLEEGAGSAFLLAHDWKDFARHVVAVLTQDAYRRGIEQSARAFSEAMFSPEAVFAEFAEVLP
jgi:glycosyltransferase involved in cell wall biosynthesis